MTTLARPQTRSRRRWPLAAALIAGLGGLGWYASAQLAPGDRGVPPIDSTTNLEVTGVHVDVYGKTAEEARTAAWREAQRKGWKLLWAHMHGTSPDAGPALSDGALDSIVSGIVVERELQGPHRYIADLGIQFDRGRTGPMVGTGESVPRSEPELVIPIEIEAGSEQSFEMRTAWQKAWARFRAGASPVDYVRPVGTGADPLLLNLGQATRPGRLWWRMLLDQYGASDVVVPEVTLKRRFPGGPVTAHFVAIHGPDGAVLGSFDLAATSLDGLDRMLDEGVKRIDAIYTQALRDGALTPDPTLTIVEPQVATNDLLPADEVNPLDTIVDTVAGPSFTIQVDTPDAAALDAAQAALRGVPDAGTARLKSVALGGTSTIDYAYAGDPAELRAALALHGWRLEGTPPAFHLRRAAAPAAAAPAAATPAEPVAGAPKPAAKASSKAASPARPQVP